MTTKKIAEPRTYILELRNGNTRKITIPSTWKMTFGQLVPYDRASPSHGNHGPALRLYEGSKENLRAVMTDVVAIRDSSIEVMEKRTQVKRQAAQKQTSKGARDVVIEARMTEWVNPDAEDDGIPPAEFLTLPVSVAEDDF